MSLNIIKMTRVSAVFALLLASASGLKLLDRGKPRVTKQAIQKYPVDVMHLDGKNHTFTIEKDNFVWDGNPVTLQAGEVHYFRIPEIYWKDRLLRIKSMGMNAIQTYVPWNFHETDEGKFDFHSDMHDLIKFLQIAKEVDMPVVLRPGPYICAEWTGGGLPGWLQSKPGLKLRTYEKQYISSVNLWWNKLLPMVKPELARNGGAVIMVQLENEFGVLGDTVNNKNDKRYIEHLRDLAVKHLGKETLLFTDDPVFGGYPVNEAMFKRGGITGVFRAINLDASLINDDIAWNAAKALQRKFNFVGKSPMFIGETYSGWFTRWTDVVVARKKTEDVVKAMVRVRNDGASLGLYMVHGGTNFGFWAGANEGSFLTSYDYNAPIREGGDHGIGEDDKDKYVALQEVFGAGRELPQEPAPPVFQTMESIDMKFAAPLNQKMDDLCHDGWKLAKGGPQPAEMYGHFLGFMAYRYRSDSLDMSGKNIAGEASDPTHIYLNAKYLPHAAGDGKRSRAKAFAKIPISDGHSNKNTIDMVVDTSGRANFGMVRKQMQDLKGLFGAKLNDMPLNSGTDGIWTTCALRFENATKLSNIAASVNTKPSSPGPSFFAAKLEVTDATKDTYLHPGEGWEKGVAFINGFNLGRYDMSSSQQELYVPASVLKKGTNEVLLLETGTMQPARMGPIDFLAQRITKT